MPEDAPAGFLNVASAVLSCPELPMAREGWHEHSPSTAGIHRRTRRRGGVAARGACAAGEAFVPAPIAQRALDLGNAVTVDSPTYRRLRESECGDFAWQPESGCAWLDQPRPTPKPAEVRASEPPIHSSVMPPADPYEGVAMTGAARAVPTR